MVRLKLLVELNYGIADPGCDFIFNIHLARTEQQTIIDEQLVLSQPIEPLVDTDPATGNRYTRVHALPGQLKVRYEATVDIRHHRALPNDIPEIPVAQLPTPVLSYIYPSRYCQSDRLHRVAMREFGHLWQGYLRVAAVQEWVRQHVTFTSNTSDSRTSAIDTFTDQVGVCRDFAHLMIALCRALNIPARFTTGIDYGADPKLGPTDFHAYVEVYLGHRWYIFDPSGTAIPMGFVRFGTGRDAADVSFATIFGPVLAQPPILRIEAVTDGTSYIAPHASADALSTACDPNVDAR